MIEPLLGRQFILHSTLYIQQSFKRKKKKKDNLYTKLANMCEEIEFRSGHRKQESCGSRCILTFTLNEQIIMELIAPSF